MLLADSSQDGTREMATVYKQTCNFVSFGALWDWFEGTPVSRKSVCKLYILGSCDFW